MQRQPPVESRADAPFVFAPPPLSDESTLPRVLGRFAFAACAFGWLCVLALPPFFAASGARGYAKWVVLGAVSTLFLGSVAGVGLGAAAVLRKHHGGRLMPITAITLGVPGVIVGLLLLGLAAIGELR